MDYYSKPNFTAWLVMQGTIAAMHQPELSNIRDEQLLALYRPLSNAASKTRLISRIICSMPYSWQYWIGTLVTHRDRLKHFCFRKMEIEQQARKLLNSDGIEQVVILGAGLDILSLRLAPEYPHVEFIEIDTFESQNFKISSFDRTAIPHNVEFITGDLREPLSDTLSHSLAFRAAAKTLWIAEGFFMFIPLESVEKLLADIRKNSATGSFAIFTTLSSYKPSSLLKNLLQMFYLRKENSPYKWAIRFEDVPKLASSLGYQQVIHVDYAGLHESYAPQKSNNDQDVAESIHIVKT